MKLYYTVIDLPTGPAFAAATQAGITRLTLKMPTLAECIQELEAEFGVKPVASSRPFAQLKKELAAYFSGEPVAFSVKLDVAGTGFQKRVWQELMKIPYGNIRSYKWLAAMAGNPKGSRAIGGALSRNRVAVVIPCHRVVQSSGGLGGFACGLDIKRKLLELEGVLPKNLLSA